MSLLPILIFGALGGTARGLVGFVKYYTSYKNVKFSWQYLGLTAGISACVGLGSVWAIRGAGFQFEGFEINPALAFILGYAGGDMLENLYKALVQKPILGPFQKLLKTTGKR